MAKKNKKTRPVTGQEAEAFLTHVVPHVEEVAKNMARHVPRHTTHGVLVVAMVKEEDGRTTLSAYMQGQLPELLEALDACAEKDKRVRQLLDAWMMQNLLRQDDNTQLSHSQPTTP